MSWQRLPDEKNKIMTSLSTVVGKDLFAVTQVSPPPLSKMMKSSFARLSQPKILHDKNLNSNLATRKPLMKRRLSKKTTLKSSAAPVPPPQLPSENVQEVPSLENLEDATNRLSSTSHPKKFMTSRDQNFKHGRLFTKSEIAHMQQPRKTWNSTKPPRDDHDCPSWLTASEFEDKDEFTKAIKIQYLADMLRMSKKTALYTGAGISAAVIGQAARSGTNKQGWISGKLQGEDEVDLVSAKAR